MSAWAWVLGGGMVATGAFILAVVICSAKLGGPDTATRDPYGLADRPGDGPELDVARAVGVDVTADGSHDDDPSMTAERWAAETALCEALYEPAVELPVVAGRPMTEAELDAELREVDADMRAELIAGGDPHSAALKARAKAAWERWQAADADRKPRYSLADAAPTPEHVLGGLLPDDYRPRGIAEYPRRERGQR